MFEYRNFCHCYMKEVRAKIVLLIKLNHCRRAYLLLDSLVSIYYELLLIRILSNYLFIYFHFLYIDDVIKCQCILMVLFYFFLIN